MPKLHKNYHWTYRQQLVNCGKSKCKPCRARPSHGPYWYAFRTTKAGKTVSRYIGKDLANAKSPRQPRRPAKI